MLIENYSDEFNFGLEIGDLLLIWKKKTKFPRVFGIGFEIHGDNIKFSFLYGLMIFRHRSFLNRIQEEL